MQGSGGLYPYNTKTKTKMHGALVVFTDSTCHHLKFTWEGIFGEGGLVMPPPTAIMATLPFNVHLKIVLMVF